MDNIIRKDYTVVTSICNSEGLLGIPNVFDIFMDMATLHAKDLGVGYYDMLKKNCFWVAVRTRVRIARLPALGESLSAQSWPGKPGLAKSDRFYRLSDAGGILAEGRTEWAVRDLETGAVRRTDSYGYPKDMPHVEDKVCSEAFTRFRDMDTENGAESIPYTVGSMDIDMGKHMNNVAYIRMLLGTFTVEELSSMDISEAEISYRIACYEGERLSIIRKYSDNSWWFQVQKPNGETAAHARFLLR